MTDAETIERLRKDLEAKTMQCAELFARTNDMRKKIKRQRLENGRLNASLCEQKELSKKLQDEIQWMKGL